jgi:hypothetical protein
MPHTVERIRGKKLWELYTAAGANKGGFSDRDDFEKIVGNTEFHSFQVWRSKEDGKATCTYALTLEQIHAILSSRDERLERLTKKLAKHKKNAYSSTMPEVKKLSYENVALQQNFSAAKAHIAELERIPPVATGIPQNGDLAAIVEHLRTENRGLEAALKPFLRKQSNNLLGGLNMGSQSIRTTSYPQGGDTTYKLGRKRR